MRKKTPKPVNSVCAVCFGPATEYHHVKTRKSGGTDDEWNLLPVNRKCHILIHAKGIITVSDSRNYLLQWLQRNGWEIKKEFGIRKLRRI